MTTSSPVTISLPSTPVELASIPLIRLVTEIDDNGPIAAPALARTMPDLSMAQLRGAVAAARALGLVRDQPGAGHTLTPAGFELADIYDVTARWARHHAYPTRMAAFATRVQATLRHVSQTSPAGSAGPAPNYAPDAHVEGELSRIGALLYQWMANHPRVQRVGGCCGQTSRRPTP